MHFLFLSIASYLIQNFSNKSFSRTFGKSLSAIQNAACVIFSAVILQLFGAGNEIRGVPFLLSVLYGILYFATVYSLQLSMSLGSLSMATILCNMGNMIGVVFGILAFGDPFNVLTVVGILCMILVVILSAPITKEEKTKGNAWFVFGLLSALGNGLLGSVKLYVAKEYPSVSSGAFLGWSFTFAAVVGLAVVLFEIRRGLPFRQWLSHPALALGCGVGAGFGTAFGNLFFMLAIASGVSSAILFPLNTGLLSFSLFLMSLLLFKEEKFTLRRFLALLFCIGGLILIRL